MIKVLHVAYSDIGGGAARAAFRIHKSLLSQKGKIEIQSSMRVINKVSQDSTVNGNRPKYESFLWRLLRPSLLIKYYKGFVLGKRTAFSVAWPKTGLGKEINNQSVDIIHLHWLGNDTLSIEEIGKIKQPIVWRLPDMWAFCGAEHYVSTITDSDKRYKNGYYSNNRPLNEKGKDLKSYCLGKKTESMEETHAYHLPNKLASRLC